MPLIKPPSSNDPKVQAARSELNAKALAAESKAMTAVGKAAKATAVELKRLAQVQKRHEDSTKKVDKATENLDKSTKELSRAEKDLGKDLQATDKRFQQHSKTLEKARKAYEVAKQGVQILQTAFKGYTVLQYDAIKASQLMTHQMGREMPKTAAEAEKRMSKLTKTYKVFRTEAMQIGKDFRVNYAEVEQHGAMMLKRFNLTLEDLNEVTAKNGSDILRRMYATRVATGASIEEQLDRMEHAVSTLGQTIEQNQSEFEMLSSFADRMAKDLDPATRELNKFRIFIRTDFVRTLKELQQQNWAAGASAEQIGKHYVWATKMAIEFGASQQTAHEWATRFTGGLMGAGSKTGLNVMDWMAGREIAGDLEGMSQEDIAKQFAGKAGVDIAELAKIKDLDTDEGRKAKAQYDRFMSQAQNVMDALERGSVADTGFIQSLMAGTDLGIKSKIDAVKNNPAFSNLMAGTSGAGAPGADLMASQLLGIENATAEQVAMTMRAWNKYSGDSDKMVAEIQKIAAETKESGEAAKEGAKATEGAAAIAKQQNLPKALETALANFFGPNAQLFGIAATMGKDIASLLLVMGGRSLLGGGGAGGVGGAAGKGAGLVGSALGTGGKVVGGGAGGAARGLMAGGSKLGVVGIAITTAVVSFLATSKMLEKFWKHSDKGTEEGLTASLSAREIANKVQTGELTADEAKAQLNKMREDAEASSSKTGMLKAFASDYHRVATSIPRWLMAEEKNPLDVLGDVIARQSKLGTLHATERFGDQDRTHGESLLEEIEKSETRIGNLPKHAAGLDSVPYDNYLAMLHKGEKVLPPAPSASILEEMLGIKGAKPGAGTDAIAAALGMGVSQGNAPKEGKLRGEAKVVGDKLVIVVSDASDAMMKLMSQGALAARGFS